MGRWVNDDVSYVFCVNDRWMHTFTRSKGTTRSGTMAICEKMPPKIVSLISIADDLEALWLLLLTDDLACGRVRRIRDSHVIWKSSISSECQSSHAIPVDFLPQGICVEYDSEARQGEVHHAAHSAVERAEAFDWNHLFDAVKSPRVRADRSTTEKGHVWYNLGVRTNLNAISDKSPLRALDLQSNVIPRISI